MISRNSGAFPFFALSFYPVNDNFPEMTGGTSRKPRPVGGELHNARPAPVCRSIPGITLKVPAGFPDYITGVKPMKTSREDLHRFEYGVGLSSLVILVAGLNILDAIFTQVILAMGGTECNPVVQAAIDVYGDRFWIWKVAAVSSLLVLICLYSRLRLFRVILAGTALLFAGVITYQIHLLANGPLGR